MSPRLPGIAGSDRLAATCDTAISLSDTLIFRLAAVISWSDTCRASGDRLSSTSDKVISHGDPSHFPTGGGHFLERHRGRFLNCVKAHFTDFN
jgi:hypothetical protein